MEIWMAEPGSWCATPTIFPSTEYVDEKHGEATSDVLPSTEYSSTEPVDEEHGEATRDVEGMVLI